MPPLRWTPPLRRSGSGPKTSASAAAARAGPARRVRVRFRVRVRVRVRARVRIRVKQVLRDGVLVLHEQVVGRVDDGPHEVHHAEGERVRRLLAR